MRRREANYEDDLQWKQDDSGPWRRHLRCQTCSATSAGGPVNGLRSSACSSRATYEEAVQAAQNADPASVYVAAQAMVKPNA